MSRCFTGRGIHSYQSSAPPQVNRLLLTLVQGPALAKAPHPQLKNNKKNKTCDLNHSYNSNSTMLLSIYNEIQQSTARKSINTWLI